MKVLQLLGGIVIIFFILSCSNQNNFEEQFPDGSVKLKYNVQQEVSKDLLLEILDVSDQRCPIGAVCSDAGFVKVDLRVLALNGNETRTMYFSELPDASQNVDTVMGYKIHLLKVSPIPYDDNPVEVNTNYIITVYAEEI